MPSSLFDTLKLQRQALCDVFTGQEEGRTPWGRQPPLVTYHPLTYTMFVNRVFGGQVFAQSLVAAQTTIEGDMRVHSCQGYFLLAGESGVELLFEVERVRDGGTLIA